MPKINITDTILRDAHQSQAATRMRLEDMLPACEILDSIGYWSLECWGGATFDSCMRFLDEDPWERLRQLRKHMPNTKLQMLLRGQNLLGYKHYADDVVDAFCQKSVENGIDVVRIFDAMNDTRNIERAMKAVKKAGGWVEGCISYTISPVHNEEYFVKLAKEIEQMGADSICIKDMANLLLPYDAYSLVKKLKQNIKVPIHLHTHNTTGTGDMVYLLAAQAGVDIIDTALSPLAGGTSQPATESMVATFQGTEFDTGLDMNKLLKASEHFRKVADKLKAQGSLDPKVLNTDAKTLVYQVPGGMLSNLISQLKQANAENKYYDVLASAPGDPHQPDCGLPGRAERAGRRALQDGQQGVQGPAARRIWPSARPGQRAGAQKVHRRRRGDHLPSRRPDQARDARIPREDPRHRQIRRGCPLLRAVPPGCAQILGEARSSRPCGGSQRRSGTLCG